MYTFGRTHTHTHTHTHRYTELEIDGFASPNANHFTK